MTPKQKKIIGILLGFTGLFVTALSCLKEGYSPASPLFPNFLLGLGAFAHGVSYMPLGKADVSPTAARGKRLSLVFLIYYIAVVAFMVARR